MNGGTYIEGNYLKFPFDVYLDVGNDGIEANDRFIRKNEWVRFSGTGVFYPGETVEEGYYTIEARTKAVNSAAGDEKGQSVPLNSNISPDSYIVADSVRVYVTGKIYGLTLYEITSKADWNNVFTQNGVNKYLRDVPFLETDKTWPVNYGTRKISSAD